MYYNSKKTDYESQIQILQYQKIKQEFEMNLIGLTQMMDQKQYEQFMKTFEGLDRMFSQLIQKQTNHKNNEYDMIQKYYREKVEELETKLRQAETEITQQRQIIKQIRKTVEQNQNNDELNRIETKQKKEGMIQNKDGIKKRVIESLDQMGELLEKEQERMNEGWDGRLKNVERLQMQLIGKIRRKL